MEFDQVFRTIESHTGGNPTRTILSGVPRLKGQTMMDKVEYFRSRYDWIRTALMFEPRGHGVMSGCVLTEPVHAEADIGVIYIEVGGYLPMCGHDTIGLVTALIESGQIPAQEPVTSVVLDTPSGVVPTQAEVKQGRVLSVSFDNVPAFVFRRDVRVRVPGLHEISVDVAWGGNFYGLVSAAQCGLELTPDHARQAIRLAQAIRQQVNEGMEIVHPELPAVRGLTHIEFYGEPTHEKADVKNMVIVPPGGVDRSPCGTGTSAKAAVLWDRGELDVGGSFVHESVTGALFTAQILNPAQVGSFPAVRVRITGSAQVYGESTFVLEPDDPLRAGFLLP
ncbi:MAG: proline racemase [Sulfobacillus acidophilus]|uniref:Proline racemase n=1 Tax=Sulfobacillus acidophilus TaxID=53633 RepID=A0A2T2WL67_9FIRM|nr:MAG: proline racemase [Sulfobacillus acidophilus]